MEPITEEEVQEMRGVLGKIFDPFVVQSWTINYEMYGLLAKLMHESGRCTAALHLVPRPWDLSNPIKYATKQVRQALLRFLTTPQNQHYIVCLKTAAIRMRTEFQLVGNGI